MFASCVFMQKYAHIWFAYQLGLWCHQSQFMDSSLKQFFSILEKLLTVIWTWDFPITRHPLYHLNYLVHFKCQFWCFKCLYFFMKLEIEEDDIWPLNANFWGIKAGVWHLWNWSQFFANMREFWHNYAGYLNMCIRANGGVLVCLRIIKF